MRMLCVDLFDTDFHVAINRIIGLDLTLRAWTHGSQSPAIVNRNDLSFAFCLTLYFLFIAIFNSNLRWPKTMAYSEDSYVAIINTVSWILGSIVIFLTCARIFGRTAVIHQAGWDDAFMGCATVSTSRHLHRNFH